MNDGSPVNPDDALDAGSLLLTTERQRELLAKISALEAHWIREQKGIRDRDAARTAASISQHEEQRKLATAEFEAAHGKLLAAYKQTREAIFQRYESEGYALAQEEERLIEEESQRHAEYVDDARNLLQLRTQQIGAAFSEQQEVPKQEFNRFKQQCEQLVREVKSLIEKAQVIVRRRAPWPTADVPTPVLPPRLKSQEYLDRAAAALGRAHEKLAEIQQQPAARFLEDGWPVLIFLFAAVAVAVALWWLAGSLGTILIAVISLVVPAILAVGVRQAVRPVAREQTLRHVPQFQALAAQVKAELTTALQAAKAEGDRKLAQLVEQKEKDLAAATEEWDKIRDQQEEIKQARLQKVSAGFVARRNAIEETHERELQELEAKYPPQIAKLERHFEKRMLDLSETYRLRRISGKEEFERESQELAAQWTSGLEEFQEAVGAMHAFCESHFPHWNGVPAAQQPRASMPAIRIGRFDFRLHSHESEPAVTAEAQQVSTSFELPAVLSFPQCPSLLLEAEGEGRDAATQVIQNVMLRLLTTFPPGKVRFTIIDPVGLGQNFSAFMHLADYDERLVTNRIWTEANHVNQRLADLTEHMENVIQKYLRNEFASIQEYNEHAGEVAEAFQILVIANFPANFSDDAARRLASIAASGARCGVYTLISVDTKLKMPRNFELADLEAQAATMVWDGEQKRFTWKYDDLRPLPLELELPPDDEQFTEIVRSVGRLAKDASRVEVPFESVTPAADKWWSLDSRSEIEVPLGRAGATKLQYMRLGKGTSQHVLISGKTGSGKSTLLNALITNLALYYAPQELQFFLIDFKKGVEFKAYANFRLPHARVIAIESEREFGMSVLERLDLELKRRGDLFRKAGVQDLKGYRNAVKDAVMPRVLLVIDEFQEFFTSDDKISHDSSLLLDRLVRQGRAFGIHVLLGSQTLAGAYSLARSTIGQMAVRIALQCSESDAHLILSEDNTAARLLSRPGEAIYNDANGLFEGNHPFQVVWLSDHQREDYLRRLSEMAEVRGVAAAPPTVFEGNVAADAADNQLLARTLEDLPPAETALAPRAWLGSAVAIKEPTEAVFRRQGGSNLLIVGQQEELAMGILATSVVALGAQMRQGPASDLKNFYILDGTRPESPEAGLWQRLSEKVSLDSRIVSPRDVPAVIGQIAAEVDRRLTAGEQNAEPIFLVIYNLARFRDLKKSEDFGLSFDDDGASAAGKLFVTILREGPPLGVHTLIWCDSFANVSRWIDRQSLRDLELRVLFQMSASDSSNLMDSPAASKLGGHMALYYSEELGQAEKFRPYGLPTHEWLAWVGERFQAGRT